MIKKHLVLFNLLLCTPLAAEEDPCRDGLSDQPKYFKIEQPVPIYPKSAVVVLLLWTSVLFALSGESSSQKHAGRLWKNIVLCGDFVDLSLLALIIHMSSRYKPLGWIAWIAQKIVVQFMMALVAGVYTIIFKDVFNWYECLLRLLVGYPLYHTILYRPYLWLIS